MLKIAALPLVTISNALRDFSIVKLRVSQDAFPN